MRDFEHGGNIHRAKRVNGAEVIDFSANINPLGSPEWLRSLMSRELESIFHYPDPEYTELCTALSTYTGVARECVVAGNGTSELLHFFMQSIRGRCSRLVLPVPSYVDYYRTAEQAGLDIELVGLDEKKNFMPDFSVLEELLQPGDLLLLGTPNNPTGCMPDLEALKELAARHPESLFLLDEAFLDFQDDHQTLGASAENICSLNSMTKFYGVPGLRIGYGLFPQDIAEEIRHNLPPWSVNSLAAAFGVRALADGEYQQQSRTACRELREALCRELAPLPLKVFPSTANYLFCRQEQGSAAELADFCAERGLLLRRCDNYRLLDNAENCFRIAVRTAPENARLVELFRDYFGVKAKSETRPQGRKRAKSIMFQGTCSDAGKSILTAGLCRILFNDGISVAPFKAQNMSLNSFVTLQGDEMGRAQVVQAQAARLDPDCRMNPVLLKPNSDTGSQVIVAGKPVGNMAVLEYNRYKTQLWPRVQSIYDSLAAEHDVIVLEGAGSPGEINLKHDDIVNMRMAQYAAAPVLLVGDIDRGGVYSSFIGIMETLAEWERRLLAGFVVNKFRGDASLLSSAHDYVAEHTGRPVFGVVPWLSHLGLPEEDSVSFKKGSFNAMQEEKSGEAVEIVVINLPHISNFTDVEPFLEEPDVNLRVVDTPDELGNPDAVILAGTKNVLHDLHYLQESGFAGAVNRLREGGCEIIGICGGYQFLGRAIRDPLQLESSLGEVEGFAFLDMVTVIEKEKNLKRKSGLHLPSGKPVFGYEIHHGVSSGTSAPLLEFEDGSHCGQSAPGSDVWGSYLHGIFDSDEFRRWYIDHLREKKGLEAVGRILAPWDLEAAFDRLATTMRENLDMKAIYRLLEL